MSLAEAPSIAALPDWHCFFHAIPTPTFLKNHDHELIAVSDSFCRLVGSSRDQTLGFQDFEVSEGAGLFDQAFESAAFETGAASTYDREVTIGSTSGGTQTRCLRIHLVPTVSPNHGDCLVGTIEDLTDLNQANLSLEVAERQSQLAFAFDPLTGLMNRTQIEASIAECLHVSEQADAQFAVLLVNLNGFKAINSTLGHSAGDHTLRICATRIRQVVQGQTAVARVSSDEYVVLLANVDPIEAGRVAERITEMIQMPIELNRARREINCSIGVSLFPRDGKTCGELLCKADQAMQVGKIGKPAGCIEFYQPSIGKDVERKLLLSRDLTKAIENNELKLLFQPIVQHVNGQDRVIGYESLARWKRRSEEWVSPEEFIPLLESSGRIIDAGEQILRLACEFIASHASDDVYVSVNVSGRQLMDDGFIDMVDRVVESTGAPFHRIKLEITETLAMDDVTTCGKLLDSLIDRGVGLMIDDFGTGYSNLSRLRELPFSMLKIDRSLIQDVPSNRSDCAILQTLVCMAKELEMGLVVEGIEDAEQRDYLVGLGVNTFQGYLFGKPKPLKHWLK